MWKIASRNSYNSECKKSNLFVTRLKLLYSFIDGKCWSLLRGIKEFIQAFSNKENLIKQVAIPSKLRI